MTSYFFTITGMLLVLFTIFAGGRSGGAVEHSLSPFTIPTSLSSPTIAPTPYSETSSITVEPVSSPTPTLSDRICAMPWPCAEALAVADCESSGEHHAYNAAGPYIGVFQIDPALHGGLAGSASLYDASANVRVAFAVYQAADGWGPWPNCRP